MQCHHSASYNLDCFTPWQLNSTCIPTQGSSGLIIQCNPNIHTTCVWISRYQPQTPKNPSLACIPGNGLLVCEMLSRDDPRNSSLSAAQGFWSECRLSYHLAKHHPTSLLLACQQNQEIIFQHSDKVNDQPFITDNFPPTDARFTHLLSPSLCGGLFLSSG